MPKVPRGRRIRSYQPKTTTGCLLCKERRVKCDEGKPACLKCTSAGRICTGYNKPQMIRSSFTDRVSIIAGPPSEIHVSTQAHRSFSFFVQLTSPQLAGFFGSDFWERLVLQSAYHEPAVRHAVVAVGALHEGFRSESKPQSNLKAFALGEYNLAIKDLMNLPENEPKRVNIWLITCILFICFENMQSCHASAGTHLRSGTKLLYETSNIRQNRMFHQHDSHQQNKPVVYTSPEILARLFSSLDSQSNLAIDRDVFMLQEKASSGATYEETPLVFSSIEEAKNTFEYGRCLFMQTQRAQLSPASSQSTANLESHVHRCTTLLSHFSLALHNMVKSKGSLLTQREEIAVAVLQLHVLYAHISLLVELRAPESSIQWQETMLSRWKSIAPLMEEMLLLGKKIILSTLCSENMYKGNTIFCLDMGIIIPIYTIATRSKDLLLRREAIALLRTTIRQEGLWNSLLAARAAERIMEIEEMIWKEKSATAYSPATTTTQVPRPLFELDAKGGRLRYFSRTTVGSEALVSVTEEMFTW